MQQSRPSSIISNLTRKSPLFNHSSTLPIDPSASLSANPSINQSINPSIELCAVCARVDGCTIVQISSRFAQNRSSSCQWTNTNKLTGSLPSSSRERYLSLFADSSDILRTGRVLAPLSMSLESSPSPESLPCHPRVVGGGCFACRVRLVGDGTSYRPIHTQIRSPIWLSDACPFVGHATQCSPKVTVRMRPLSRPISLSWPGKGDCGCWLGASFVSSQKPSNGRLQLFF